jgi:heme A synthase
LSKKKSKKTGSGGKRPSRQTTGRPKLLRRQMKPPPPRRTLVPSALTVPRWLMRLVQAHFWLLMLTVGVGTLQTSLRGGAVIPGWPGSFQSPWIFCPLTQWFGHWDVFAAQSHRLLGYGVAVLLAVVGVQLFRRPKKSPLLRSLVVLLLMMLVGTAVVGGLRIRLDDRMMANYHALASTLYLIGSVALMEKMRIVAPEDSRQIRRPETPEGMRWAKANRRLLILAFFGLFSSCLQVFAGVQMRHIPLDAAPFWFMVWIWTHVLGAILLGGLMAVTAWRLSRLKSFADRHLRHRGNWLWGLLGLQALLGVSTWVLHYNWPLWFYRGVYPAIYTIRDCGFFQVWATTLHVVFGYLVVAVFLSVVFRLRRRGRVTLPVDKK